jgi:hypothetical protein
MEVVMGSVNRRDKFNPEELELIDRVYAVTCAYIEARDLYHVATDAEEQDALRQMMFAVAASTPLDFDALCDRVLVSMDNFRARRVAQS